MGRNKYFPGLLLILIFATSMSHRTAYSAPAQVSEGNVTQDRTGVLQLGRIEARACQLATMSRSSHCETAANTCNDVWDGDGSGGPNKFLNIPPETFKADVQNCAAQLEQCKEWVIQEQTPCCCSKSPNLGPEFDSHACSQAQSNLVDFCFRAATECRSYSDSIQNQTSFTTTGLSECHYYSTKCQQWGQAKDARCQCRAK